MARRATKRTFRSSVGASTSQGGLGHRVEAELMDVDPYSHGPQVEETQGLNLRLMPSPKRTWSGADVFVVSGCFFSGRVRIKRRVLEPSQKGLLLAVSACSRPVLLSVEINGNGTLVGRVAWLDGWLRVRGLRTAAE